MARPIVVIVGRTNVGKSTLFNRVVGRRQAVVDDQPGVTRDRNAAIADWNGREFRLIDTGGLVPGARTGMDAHIRSQVELALETADLVLYVVDAQAGVIPLDRQIAGLVRRSERPFILVANKAESHRVHDGIHEFSALGLGEAVGISALHGDTIGDLLDEIVNALPEVAGAQSSSDAVQVAIVGRPNVGKSSLVNRMLGEERMIVDEVPGTTRDAVDSEFQWNDKRFVLIDTAGLRRRAQIDTRTEYYCTVRAFRSVERCDVAVQVIDASVPFSRQDYRISNTIVEAARPAVLVFNKWDLVEKETLTSKHLEEAFREHVHDLWHAPAVFISALTGQRAARLPELILAGYLEARRRIGRETLSRALAAAIERVHPPATKRGRFQFGKIVQVGADPIRIVVETRQAAMLPTGYRRYLMNSLRGALGIEMAPIRLEFREPRRKSQRRGATA